MNLFFFILQLFIHNVNNSSLDVSYSKVDSVFMKWNRTTIQSLNEQYQKSDNDLQRNLYLNRDSALKAFWDIEDGKLLNKKSTRYLFLKKIYPIINKHKSTSFTVIEANRSGESLLIRNFLVLKDARGRHTTLFLTFVGGTWNEIGSAVITQSVKSCGVCQNLIDYPLGNNKEDVIITRFSKFDIDCSEYFLPSTLKECVQIEEIFKSYKKENFYGK